MSKGIITTDVCYYKHEIFVISLTFPFTIPPQRNNPLNSIFLHILPDDTHEFVYRTSNNSKSIQ